MRYLFILNDPAYGTERSDRRRGDLCRGGAENARRYYDLERMLKIPKSKGAEIGVCGTCMDGRGSD